jgi:ribosome biogenesis GTPase
VRESDSRGRHTTTHRELVILPGGGIVIDTPGMRELQLWAGDESLTQAFADIDGLAASCRFADCSHEHEPGCAVRAALQSGVLDARRYENYRKQKRELAYLHRKQDPFARNQERRRWKQIAKAQKRNYKERGH